jgi:hypothetical protein
MTIVYLPLSFVAVRVSATLSNDSADNCWKQALFGMHIFDGNDLQKTQSSFYICAVLIPLVTYILSGLAVWWAGDLEGGQELKDSWQSWRAKDSSRKDKFKVSTETNHDKTEGAQSFGQESMYASLRKRLRPRKKDGVGHFPSSSTAPEP